MSTNVYATQDTYTLASSQGSNFDGADLLVNGAPHRAYSYIEFDLSAFAGKEITEALIKLYIVVNNLTSNTIIRFYRIDQPWNAGVATYNNPPHVTSTNAKNKTLENEDSGWEQWNITDLVKDIISSGGHGIRVEIDADANPGVWFSSIEGGNKAKIVITEAVVPAANGFTINVATGLANKPLLVAHVVKMPFIGLVGPDPDLWYWPQAFDYVGGKWFLTDPATKYRVEVGSIFETIPSFDKTYGTGSFADGIHCVVLAEGEGGVGSLIFKGSDVFQLFKDSPTEIYLSATSTDVLTEAVMGPVCDFFGIPRGSACSSFWAEFYDPVYVANYISIRQTGKDTLGNERELSGFDHIALPFAVLGSLPGLSLLPFGALVTKGLGAVSKAGAKFGDTAVQFMLNFSMDATNKISSKDTWYFLDAIGQVTEDNAVKIVSTG
jgi:hypothetical protein